jgi:hypothetical protein
MIFDYWLAGLVTAGLLAYLPFARALRGPKALERVRGAPTREAIFQAVADSGGA